MVNLKRGDVTRAAEILSLPALKGIPQPDLPLTGLAYDKYRELAMRLHAESKLNVHTKGICEQIGLLHAKQFREVEFGRNISGRDLDRLDKLYSDLRIVDKSEGVAAEPEQKENRFARFGIITSRRAEAAPIRSP